MNNDKFTKILSAMTHSGIPQLLISDPAVIYYLTGVSIQPGERMLVLVLRQDGNHRFFINDLFRQTRDLGAPITYYNDTQDGTAMADTIFQQLGRTCTILEGTGLISGNKAVLYCVITRLELPAMRRIIHNADQSAFVTVSDVSEIIGNHIKQLPPQADADKKPT